jgi:hypothetical protein
VIPVDDETGTVTPMTAEQGVFVYGVVGPELVVPDDLTGIDDAPVRVVVHDRTVGALVSTMDLERPPGRRADLLAYSRVLDSLAVHGPVVPVRFGSVMEDDESVAEVLLADDVDLFTELLAELSGRVQFTLRASYVESVVLAEVAAEDPEIARLHAATRDVPVEAAYGQNVRLGELVAAALEAKRGWDSQMVVETVEPHVVALQERAGGGLDHVVNLALLVDDERQDELEQLLEELAEAVHERMRLRLVGPVAAYDFVGEG